MLFPNNPESVTVTRSVTPNITTFSLPFSRFGHAKIGARCTVVRLTSGALAVFSPVAITPAVSHALESVGNNVKYLIAPDFEHHIYLDAWHDLYPTAQLIGPEGLYEKRKADPKRGDIAFGTIFTKKNAHSISISPEFDADFEYEYIPAHPNKEIVFFYKPDRVMIEADLLMSFPATEQYSKSNEPLNGFLTRLFYAMGDTTGTAIGHKRALWYLFSRSDRAGFNKSAERINKWDFVTIIPCHGDVIEGNGKQIFEKVFEWHLKGSTS